MHIASDKFPAVQSCKTKPKYVPERLGTSITEYIRFTAKNTDLCEPRIQIQTITAKNREL